MPKTHAFIIVFIAFIALSLSLASTASAESAAGLVEKGNEAFAAGKFDEAIAAYDKALEKNPDAAQIHYNKGCALYMTQAYDEAADRFSLAALQNDDPAFRARTHFNMGNCLFQKSRLQENTDLQNISDSLEKSVRHYEKALDLDASLDAAANNLELARMALKSVREAIEKQPEGQSCKNPREGNENSDDQQQASQQQQQEAEPSDQSGEQEKDRTAEAAGVEDPEKILQEEQKHRMYRQSTDGSYRPVEKDW